MSRGFVKSASSSANSSASTLVLTHKGNQSVKTSAIGAHKYATAFGTPLVLDSTSRVLAWDLQV